MKPILWQRALRDSDLEPPSKSVGWALSTYADAGDGTCFPSYPTIAAATGLARRTVITHVHKLVDLGWLLKFKRVSKHGQESNVYRLVEGTNRLVDNPPELGPKVEGGVPQLHGGECNRCKQGVQKKYGRGGATVAPIRGRSIKRADDRETNQPLPVDNPTPQPRHATSETQDSRKLGSIIENLGRQTRIPPNQ